MQTDGRNEIRTRRSERWRLLERKELSKEKLNAQVENWS